MESEIYTDFYKKNHKISQNARSYGIYAAVTIS